MFHGMTEQLLVRIEVLNEIVIGLAMLIISVIVMSGLHSCSLREIPENRGDSIDQ
ncbi:hypothetical protein [Schlesneria paludicola]|uniref:hypothetical protein n=1 Tax=Schlesneria paludicola TaxID=360056 RepID=UPI0002E26B9B|nr:hypothetical protein [Schlesneria paludicola]